MNKNAIITIIVVIVVILVGALGFLLYQQSTMPANESTNGNSQGTQSANGSTEPDTPLGDDDATALVSVEMRDIAFSPSEITVERGTTVIWTNEDNVQHNVIAADPNNTGGLPTTAPLLSQGETFSFTFDEVGTFEYLCEVHQQQMRGTVTVTE